MPVRILLLLLVALAFPNIPARANGACQNVIVLGVIPGSSENSALVVVKTMAPSRR